MAYKRSIKLHRLVQVSDINEADPNIISPSRYDIALTAQIIDRLERAETRHSRLRDRANWSYDCNLHIGVLQALAAEQKTYTDQLNQFLTTRAAPA